MPEMPEVENIVVGIKDFIENKKIVDVEIIKGDVIKSVEIKKGTTSSIDAILENDAEVLMSNGSNKDVTQEIKLDDTFNAPILEGQKLGEVEFSINGNVVSTVNLVANKSSDKLSFGSIIKFVMNKWFNMLR